MARAVVAQTPLLGAVTDTSAVLVVRTSKPATVVVHYGTGVLDSATAPVVTKSTHDNAAHIALEGLLPETTYSYAVFAHDGVTHSRGIEAEAQGRFDALTLRASAMWQRTGASTFG